MENLNRFRNLSRLLLRMQLTFPNIMRVSQDYRFGQLYMGTLYESLPAHGLQGPGGRHIGYCC